MRIVLFEPRFKGHHGLWLAHALDALRPLPDAEVVLVTGTDFESAAARVPALATAARGVEVAPVLESGDELAVVSGARKRIEELRSVLERQHADWVYVLYADGMSQVSAASVPFRAALRRSGTTVEAVQFRAPVCYPEYGGRVRARVHWLASELAPWTYRHHLDPFFVEGPRAPAHLHHWDVFPDVVEEPRRVLTRSEAREELDLPVDGRLIVAAGLLGGVKGTIELVRAFLSARRRRDDLLVLAGPHDADLAAFVAGCPRDSIVSRDEWIDPDQLVVYLQAATVVATPYPAHVGSVSIVLRAAGCARFVLGSRTGWQGPMIPAFGLGLAVDPTQDALASGIERSLDIGDAYVPSEESLPLLEFHSPANFRAHLVDRIRAAGLRSNESAPISWDTVCSRLPGERVA